jgi:hypothetical protein
MLFFSTIATIVGFFFFNFFFILVTLLFCCVFLDFSLPVPLLFDLVVETCATRVCSPSSSSSDQFLMVSFLFQLPFSSCYFLKGVLKRLRDFSRFAPSCTLYWATIISTFSVVAPYNWRKLSINSKNPMLGSHQRASMANHQFI